MKSLIVTLALITAPSAFATHHEGHHEANFETAKTTILANLDKRVESLNKMKTCVQAATAMAAVKECRKTHHTEMAAIKDDMMEQRKKH